MSLFIPPTVRATDDNNNALSGAKWYFYLTGTTTLATVYTDDGLTTPATNPVVANGGGLFAPIYLDPAVIYRSILKDAAGVQIQDIDPVSRELLTDLAAATGSTLIMHKSAAAGTFARTLRQWAVVGGMDEANVMNWIDDDLDPSILDDSNTTDLATSVQNALDSFSTPGGQIFVPNGVALKILTDLDIPNNASLVGRKAVRGMTNNAPNLNTFMPRISLARTATITLNNGAEIANLAVFANSITFSDTSTNVNAWTGTAITLGDNCSDQQVHDSLIIGFGTAISTGSNTRVDRPRIWRVYMDCVNGIYIKNAHDVPYIRDCHGYPWSTLESTAETNDAHLKRAGSFIQLDGTTNDQAKISDCFNYGYKTGYRMSGADSFTLLNCGADNPPSASDGSIGFLVEGTSFEGRLIGCQASGRVNGFEIDTTDTNNRVFLNACNAWATLTNAVHVVHGDVSIIGGGLRNTGGSGNGVYVEDTATRVRLIGTMFDGFSTGIKKDSAGSVVIHDNCNFTGCTTNVTNPYVPSILSADPLVLDGESTFFVVQGTNNFDTISGADVYAGKMVTLKFTGALFVSTGDNLKLAGGSNFNTSADDTITFRSDGTNWYEVSRSANS